MFRFVAERSGGSSFRIAAIVSPAESPRNGRWPESISYRITPRAKMSLLASAGSALICSGEM